MKSIINALKVVLSEHYTNKKKIQILALNEIKIMSSGTSLGYFWTLFKDVIYFAAYTSFLLLVYGNVLLGGLPRMVFLVTALIPWYFISDCLGGGSAAIRKRGSILTKMKFPMTIIPTYDVLSIFYKRIASYIIMFVILTFSFVPGTDIRYIHEVHWLLFLYYTFAMVVFMMAFNLLISGFVAISKDFSELYSSIVRIMFFFVPIMWSFDRLKSMPAFVSYLVKMNPLVYILEGTRNSLTGLENMSLEYTIYFWIVTFVIFICGAYIQNKLRKIYADFL